MVRVLFVCLGNICRSPMAEAVFMHKVREAKLENEIQADSAGTGDWHVGSAPHFGTQAVLTANKISFDHAARVLIKKDFEQVDLICTMDEDNFDAVTRMRRAAPGKTPASVRRLLEFAPDAGLTEVPDPYYDNNFEQTFELVSEAADGLLAFIRSEYKL